MPGPIPPAAPTPPAELFDGNALGLMLVAEIRAYIDRRCGPIEAQLATLSSAVASLLNAMPTDPPPDDAP